MAVKANQGRLYRLIEAIVSCRKPVQPSLTTQNQQRGRTEKRCLRVFSAHGIDPQQWPAVKTIVAIDRQRNSDEKDSKHCAYYISSLRTTAAIWSDEVRGHWSIENRLHWPKDVLLNEDDIYGREANALLTASLFRSITINLLRLNGFKSIASALRELANQVERIFRLLQ